MISRSFLLRRGWIPLAILAAGIALGAVVALVAYRDVWPQPRGTRWTMINVSPGDAQADSHLIEFADGTRMLVDTGEGADAPGVLLPFLQQKRIKRLDLVVISHFHLDHYGRLEDIVRSGIQVKRVVMNLPASREIADRERPWGCDWDHVQALLAFLRERNIPYSIPKAGERLVTVGEGQDRAAVDVVCLYDGINTPIGQTDMNDTSILLRLSHGKTRALFTGDLNHALGAYLAGSDFDLSADLLKVPHHGTEGVAPNEFFERVNPKVAMVPSPRALWYSIRSKRIREFFSERSIPAYVNGIHGHVRVLLSDSGFEIQPERER